MEFIMLCYPVREVTLWQWIGNPHSFSLPLYHHGRNPRTPQFERGRPRLDVGG